MTLRALGVRRVVIGAALMRVSLGLAILYEYAINYPQRYYLWGPERVAGEFAPALPFSPYLWSSTDLHFEVVFHAGVLVTCLFVLGIGGRLTTLAVYAMTFFLQEQNPLITDGGDNLTRVVLPYLVFADLSGRRDRNVSIAGGVLHNAAVLAVVVQLAALYLATGLYKVMGDQWQSGVALYYVMRVNTFSWSGLGELLYPNMYAVVALTYGTVAFEVAFPFLLFNRWTRWGVLAGGVAFHVGIAAVMGLWSFSSMILSLYFVCVSDREYERARSVFSTAGSGVVLYDGECGFCGRFAGFVKCADRRGAFELEPLQGARARRALEARGVDGRRLDTLYVIDAEGNLLGRSAAVIFVLRCLGWPWSWAAVFAVLPVRVRDAMYNAFAQNRWVFGGATCDVSARSDPRS